MNIKLQKLIRLFNQRKAFFNAHPDAYSYMKNTFKTRQEEGTEIQVIVNSPRGTSSSVTVRLQESDMEFFDCIAELLSE